MDLIVKHLMGTVTALCLIASCQLGGPDEVGLRVQTDRRSYEAGQDIDVTIHNDGRSVFLSHCCGRPFVGLDVIDVDGGWTEVRPSTGFCIALCDGSPMTLEPGNVRHARLTVSEPGRYRLRILFGETRSEITEMAVSSEFTVMVR